MLHRQGELRRCLEARVGCEEWEVAVDGALARAVALPELTGPLRVGDAVLLNTTAVTLSLGTGGRHFILARLGPDLGAEESPASAPFSGREAGHILKLRYTPLQHRVLAVEEEASTHHAALAAFQHLAGMPVLATELLSQAGAACVAARAAAPTLRIVVLHLDSAALPVAHSRLLFRLRGAGVIDAIMSVGQSFGGDLEAVNVYSGLAAARAVAAADLVVATQGPGNAGTRTRLGFSGMAVLEALHAADFLGGQPALAPRISGAEERARHHGLSHHTRTLLEASRVPLTVPHAEGTGAPDDQRHTWAEVDPGDWQQALMPFADVLTTMGRSLEQDPHFFRNAAAAGIWGASVGVGSSVK
jgi:hypothetical protein